MNRVIPSAVTQQLCSNACLYQKIYAWCQSCLVSWLLPLDLGCENPNKFLLPFWCRLTRSIYLTSTFVLRPVNLLDVSDGCIGWRRRECRFGRTCTTCYRPNVITSTSQSGINTRVLVAVLAARERVCSITDSEQSRSKVKKFRVASTFWQAWCHLFFGEVFFFWYPGWCTAPPLPSFTDVSEKVSALCNCSLQARGPSRSLPVLLCAKPCVGFGHIPTFLSKPECNVNLSRIQEHLVTQGSVDAWSCWASFRRPSCCCSSAAHQYSALFSPIIIRTLECCRRLVWESRQIIRALPLLLCSQAVQ